MRCDRHRKDFVGRCMWCGKQLCNLCVARRDGNKLYCDKCRGVLGSVRRTQLPKQTSSSGRRFVMRDGYLVIEGTNEH